MLSLLLILFEACVKDKPEVISQSPVTLSSGNKVYVINEGNYGSGNSSVTLYDVSNKQIVQNLYFVQNNASIGDVMQSMNKINNKYFLVVNNSKKIIICDEQFKLSGQINNLTSPRYIQQVTNQKAYVSDLYSNVISVVDLNSTLKIAEIKSAGKTEQMAMIYNKVFVCNSERAYVYVINTTLDLIQDSIYVGLNASSLIIDKLDALWVLASGDQTQSKGRLSKINTIQHKVETYFEFDLSQSPWQLKVNKTKDSVYFLNSDVFRMSINDVSLPAQAFIKRGSRNFYGLGINTANNTVFVSDALDFSQASNVYVYDTHGNQIDLFKAGINANGFYFE